MKAIKRKKTLKKRKKTFRIRNNHRTLKKGKKHIIKMTGGVPPAYSKEIKDRISQAEWDKVEIESKKAAEKDLKTYNNSDDNKENIVRKYVLRDIMFRETLPPLRELIFNICSIEKFMSRDSIHTIITESQMRDLILASIRIHETMLQVKETIKNENNNNNVLYIEQQIINYFENDNILNMNCLDINKLLFLLFHAYVNYLPTMRGRLE